ncbi:MAG: hypothetical protein J6U05_04065 [Neisseriaceae bacterium]|nr:hypothetical protein [Neisseriaceae bacterium]
MENSLTVKLGDFKCYPCPCTTVTYVALDKNAHPTAFLLFFRLPERLKATPLALLLGKNAHPTTLQSQKKRSSP